MLIPHAWSVSPSCRCFNVEKLLDISSFSVLFMTLIHGKQFRVILPASGVFPFLVVEVK